MRIILEEKENYILRFDSGEEVIGGLQKYCAGNSIHAAWFSALGACKEVTLSFYDLAGKKYRDTEIKEDLEIAGISGNVAQLNGKPIIHAHGSFSGKNLETRSGHIKSIVVSATCEVFLMRIENRMERNYDDVTGLNLLKPHNESR